METNTPNSKHFNLFAWNSKQFYFGAYLKLDWLCKPQTVDGFDQSVLDTIHQSVYWLLPVTWIKKTLGDFDTTSENICKIFLHVSCRIFDCIFMFLISLSRHLGLSVFSLQLPSILITVSICASNKQLLLKLFVSWLSVTIKQLNHWIMIGNVSSLRNIRACRVEIHHINQNAQNLSRKTKRLKT